MFEDIPNGKDDLPILMPAHELTYDIDDVDGQEYMLDHRLAGCFCFFCTKEIKNAQKAKATLDGQEIPVIVGRCKLGPHYETLVGIRMQGYVNEYGKEYAIHIEGIEDIDGNMMLPVDLSIHTLEHPKEDMDYIVHDNVALDIAREGMVLLKNKGKILPLGKNAKINIFGSGFSSFRLGASGAGRINPRYSVRLFDGIENNSSLKINPILRTFYTVSTNRLPDEGVLKEAAIWSQTAVIAITRGTSENFDNLAFSGEFYLTDEEDNMIREVCQHFSDTVLLLNTGYPIDVRCVEKYGVSAVLWTGLCGMNGGRAVAEILEGTVNPSGKLPDTWSLTWEDIPSSKNFYQPSKPEGRIDGNCTDYINTVYEEGLYVGYRYYDTFGKPTAYLFGHGLSYTSFACSFMLESQTEGSFPCGLPEKGMDDVMLTVRASVTNTGSMAGKEVVQIYAGVPDGKLEQPKRRLIGFGKTNLLEPGESQEISLSVTGHELASFDTGRAAWICEAGEWIFYGGNSLENSFEFASIVAEKEVVLAYSRNYMPLPEGFPLKTLSKLDEKATYPVGTLSGKTGKAGLTPHIAQKFHPEQKPILPKKAGYILQWKEVVGNPDLLEDFVGQFSDYELARMCICAKNGWGMEEKGEAGRLYVFEKYGMPEFAFADGNNGVNLNKKNIGFPVSVTVCATFNEELACKAGTVIAEEALELGIQCILAPAANLHRNPLGGRNAEYFSEDPLLAGRMAGMQCRGLEENGVAGCAKHILANNCESSRLRNNSIIDERTLRELYMKVFEELFYVHNPATLMTSYNAVNGVYCAESEEMIQGLFIKELEFDGFVMTDWTSCDTCDIVDAVAGGNGWITPGGMDDVQANQLADGRIERARILKSVYRMLKTVLKFTFRAENEKLPLV